MFRLKKKYRQVYSKNINGFEYNIMIDKIDGVGKFYRIRDFSKYGRRKRKVKEQN